MIPKEPLPPGASWEEVRKRWVDPAAPWDPEVDAAVEREVFLEEQRLKLIIASSVEAAMRMCGFDRGHVAGMVGLPTPVFEKMLDDGVINHHLFARVGLGCGIRWKIVGVDAGDPSKVIISSDPDDLKP